MANYLRIFHASDLHIDFIAQNPDTLIDFLDGERPTISVVPPVKPTFWQRLTGNIPQPKAPPEIPADWPTDEITLTGSEINHRNTDLFHLILNGSEDFVTGSGSLFQTWHETPLNHTHSAIDISGGYNENFAFHSGQMSDLLELISAVDAHKVKLRFTQWLEAKGEDYAPNDEECSELLEEFVLFATVIQGAITNSLGLVWISN